MIKRILGLDLGTNSIGWALLEEDEGQPKKILALGSRVFIKAVDGRCCRHGVFKNLLPLGKV